MAEQKFGIWEVRNTRYCSRHSCKGIAKAFIGDKNAPHLRTNMYLCEDDLRVIFKGLLKKYGSDIAPDSTEETKTNIDSIKGQEIIYDFINRAYENGGVLSKTLLLEVSKANGVELPEDLSELNMKKYMRLMFPDILKEEVW